MSPDTDDSGGEVSKSVSSSWRNAIHTTWQDLRRRFESASPLVQTLLGVILSGLIQAITDAFNLSVNSFLTLAPPTPAGQLSVVILGLILLQSVHFHRRFNRMEAKVESMGNSSRALADGGSNTDFVQVVLAALSGALIGSGLAVIIGFSEYQIFFSVLFAIISLSLLNDDST